MRLGFLPPVLFHDKPLTPGFVINPDTRLAVASRFVYSHNQIL